MKLIVFVLLAIIALRRKPRRMQGCSGAAADRRRARAAQLDAAGSMRTGASACADTGEFHHLDDAR
jgi:hypothetical protein